MPILASSHAKLYSFNIFSPCFLASAPTFHNHQVFTAETISPTLLCSKCPNHLNLPCLTISAPQGIQNRKWQIHTAFYFLSFITHLSHHHSFYWNFSDYQHSLSQHHMSWCSEHKIDKTLSLSQYDALCAVKREIWLSLELFKTGLKTHLFRLAYA